MLSYLDPLLFPDECDILEVSTNRYVYPIFKNGSSSLYESGFRKLSTQEVAELNEVEILVRDPFDRFVSGVHSYVEYLDPDLDRTTALHFINQHIFLNRHFATQFHWLVNLQRYTRAKIKISPMTELASMTDLKFNDKPKYDNIRQQLGQNNKIHFYLQLDKVLTENLLGTTADFQTIVATLKFNYPAVYQEIIERSKTLCNVLV
jgi:hypothetical protein